MNDEKATTTTTGFGARGANAPPPQEQGGKVPTPSRCLQEYKKNLLLQKALNHYFPPALTDFQTFLRSCYCMEKIVSSS